MSALFSSRGLTAVSTMFLATMVPVPAHADVKPQYLPSASQVSHILRDSSTWKRHRYDYTLLGSRPRGCKSTEPFESAEQSLKAMYGQVRPPLSNMPSATISIYEFLTPDDASAAVVRAASLVGSCGKSTEWWCTQCDGIITYWRRAVAPPMVGEQATSWVGRAAGNSLSRYRAVVARKGSSVVAVTVWTSNAPGTKKLRYPRCIPSSAKTARLAAKVIGRVP